MEKNTYETYEYLPANDNETGHFFIVQDDAPFLMNRQVQYVSQMQNSKPVMDNVVYDITPQQFLVDVGNSPELISVSDQFILPEGDNNLYTNGYLIQPETNASTEQMEQDVAVSHCKHNETMLNLDVVAQSNKEANNCTEITLSDEQYQMLEQKGWILLELNNKIYLLDTLGLHDISTNDKLIHKLKNESQSNINQEVNNGIIKLENQIQTIEDVSQTLSKQPPNLVTSIEVLDQNTDNSENFPFKENNTEGQSTGNQNMEATNTDVNYTEIKQEDVHMQTEQTPQDNDSVTRILVIDSNDIRREGTALKIKTGLSLKNFPAKIVLGKTVNGKQLVAKVVKLHIGAQEPVQVEPKDKSRKAVNERKWEIDKNLPAIHLGNLLNENEFLTLIRHLLYNNIYKCTADDIVAADTVIAQLLQLPAFKATVMDSNLVVTKTVQNEDSSGKALDKDLSAVVTGKVTSVNGEWHFVHLPHMLQKMTQDTEELLTKFKNVETIDLSKRIFHVLHVQISESKQSGTNVIKVSVTVNKRSIPMNLISNIHKSTKMYACSACASVFKTEELLKEHQTDNCLGNNVMVTEDTETTSPVHNNYTVIDGKTKSYLCSLCKKKFLKLSTIKNHLRTHSVQDVRKIGDQSKTGDNSPSGVYKCNMCPSSYFHPSTLSKHILSTHIKIKI